MPLLARAAVAALLVLTPAAAHAQLGGLMKRAAERAADKAAAKTVDRAVDRAMDDAAANPACAPTFDRTTVELTGDVLDRLVKGFEAQAAAGSKGGRDGLVKQREQLQARMEDFEDDPVLERWERSRGEYNSCRLEVQSSELEEKVAANPMALFAGDPERMRRMRQLEERAAAAEKRGDDEQAKAIRDSMGLAMMGGPLSKEAEAKIAKKCGPAPTEPKRVAQRDSVRAALRTLDDKITALDDEHGDVLYETSGLTRRQVAMARERIQLWLSASGRGGAGTVCGFSRAEQSALADRREKLRQHVR